MEIKKPFKKTITHEVVNEYWDCGKGHNHMTELVALKCHRKEINKLLNPNLTMTEEDRRKRNRKMLWAWVNGKTKTEISKEINLSVTRITELIHRFTRYSAYAKYMPNRSLLKTLTPELQEELLKTELGKESTRYVLKSLEDDALKAALPKITLFKDNKFIGWDEVDKQINELEG